MRRSAPSSRRLLLLAAIAPAWLACADAPTGTAAPGARAERTSAHADAPLVTLEWQEKARALATANRLSPTTAVRAFALLGVAQYRAIDAADYGGGTAQFEVRRGAVAAASARVLGALFPAVAGALAQEAVDDGAIGVGGTHPQYRRGLATGLEAGDAVLAWGAQDGFARAWDRTIPAPGEGGWIAAPGVAPAGFQFPTMKLYYLDAPGQFRPAPPVARGSAAFLAALAVVRQTTLTRTTEQIASANHWNALGANLWLELGATLAVANALDEREAAHLMGVASAAMLDAVIGCFEAKYHYNYVRPSQADPAITQPPGLPGAPYTLPNHPSYPSGHSCIAAAGARVLTEWFPTSSGLFATRVQEAGMSRVIGGLHYMFDVAAGQELGRRVAEHAIANDRVHGAPALGVAATP